MSIGQKIREIRTLAGMSQEELGRRIGVQRAAINKYESNAVENIPIKTIEKIANVFDVSPTYLVGWNGENSNPMALEVKILHGVKKFYGQQAVELLETYTHISSVGKKRLQMYADELERIYID